MGALERFRQINENRLKRNGAKAIVRIFGDSTFDPSTGTVTRSETDHTVKARFLEYETTDVDGTTIVRGDREVVVSAVDLTATPRTGDLVFEGTDTSTASSFEVVAVMRKTVQMQPTAWVLQVRSG